MVLWLILFESLESLSSGFRVLNGAPRLAGYSTRIAGRNVDIGLSFIQMWSRTIERLFRDSIELDYLHPPPLGGSSCWIWQAMVARCVEKHLFRRHSKFCTAFRNSHGDSLEIIQLFLENFISHGGTAGSQENKPSLRIFTANAVLGIFGERTVKPLDMAVMALPTGENVAIELWLVAAAVTHANK